MVKMVNGGITIEVVENEVDFYKRAGYSVVEDVKPAASAETVAPAEVEEESAAPKKVTTKK